MDNLNTFADGKSTKPFTKHAKKIPALMESLIPWLPLEAVIELLYPKPASLSIVYDAKHLLFAAVVFSECPTMKDSLYNVVVDKRH